MDVRHELGGACRERVPVHNGACRDKIPVHNEVIETEEPTENHGAEQNEERKAQPIFRNFLRFLKKNLRFLELQNGFFIKFW